MAYLLFGTSKQSRLFLIAFLSVKWEWRFLCNTGFCGFCAKAEYLQSTKTRTIHFQTPRRTTAAEKEKQTEQRRRQFVLVPKKKKSCSVGSKSRQTTTFYKPASHWKELQIFKKNIICIFSSSLLSSAVRVWFWDFGKVIFWKYSC